jgi:hypothetical protein
MLLCPETAFIRSYSSACSTGTSPRAVASHTCHIWLLLLLLLLLLPLPGLEPGAMLANLFQQVPELCQFANLDLQVSRQLRL